MHLNSCEMLWFHSSWQLRKKRELCSLYRTEGQQSIFEFMALLIDSPTHSAQLPTLYF